MLWDLNQGFIEAVMNFKDKLGFIKCYFTSISEHLKTLQVAP